MKSFFKILCFGLLILSPIFQAQTHRFLYELKYKYDSLVDDRDTETMVLDIDPKEVKFYDYGFVQTDSLSKVNADADNQYTSQTQQTIVRAHGSAINSNYNEIDFLPYYYVYKTTDKMQWKIENETKMLGEFHLQKATTHYGGRDWIAWFTTDIPIPEGPNVFRGLPGLILILEDTKQNFVYTFIKNQNLPKTYDTHTFLETHYGRKPIQVSLDTWKKLNLQFYADPYSYMRTNFKPDWNVKIDGIKITSKDQFNSLTKTKQAEIKKYNNPVNLENAVHYPS